MYAFCWLDVQQRSALVSALLAGMPRVCASPHGAYLQHAFYPRPAGMVKALTGALQLVDLDHPQVCQLC